VLLVFFYGLSDAQRAVWLFQSMVWLVIIGNVVTVVDALNIPDLGLIHERDGRVGGPIGHPNEYAAFLVLFLPAIIAIFRTSKGLKKLLAAGGLFFSGLALLMTVSRGAFVGLAASGVVGAYFLRAVIPPKMLARAGFAAVLMCVVVIVGGLAAGYGDILIERFGQFGGDRFEASSGRTMIWLTALDRMLEHPVTFVTGYGWYAWESYIGFAFATHNTYVNILYNLGMIGLTLFLLAVGNVLRAARAALNRAGSEARPLLIAFVFGFLALLITIFFGELFNTWLYVWAFVGISLRLAILELVPEPTMIRRRETLLGNDNKAPHSES
jgi:O-antigen ligase